MPIGHPKQVGSAAGLHLKAATHEDAHLVILKYGSWSMAQGMRHLMSLRCPNMWGKVVGKDGAACTAGNATCPMLDSPLKPKMPLAEL